MAPTNQHPPVVIVVDGDDDAEKGASSSQVIPQYSQTKATSNILKPQFVQMKRAHNKRKAPVVSVSCNNQLHHNKMLFRLMKPAELKELDIQDPKFMPTIEQKLKSQSPFRELFKEFRGQVLSILLTSLTENSNPPQSMYPVPNEVPPPWWPSTRAKWWVKSGFPTDRGEPPYSKAHALVKLWKLAVLASIIDCHCRKFVCKLVRKSAFVQAKLNLKEKFILASVLECWNRPNSRVDYKLLSDFTGCRSYRSVLQSVKTEEADMAESSTMAMNKRSGMVFPLGAAVEEEMVEFDRNSTILGPSALHKSDNFAANCRLQQMQIASNGFNDAESSTGKHRNEGWRMLTNKAVGHNLKERKKPTFELARNGVALALPSFMEQGRPLTPSENAANVDKTSTSPVVLQVDQGQSTVFQTTHNQVVNPNLNSLSKNPVNKCNQEDARNTAAKQGCPTVSSQTVIAETANEKYQFTVNRLPNADFLQPQVIAGSQMIHQPQPSFSQVNCPSSSGGPYNEYNQVTVATENGDIKTVLASGDSTVTNMNWEASQERATGSSPAAFTDQGNLRIPQKLAAAGSGTLIEGPPMNRGKVNTKLISLSEVPVYECNQMPAASTGKQLLPTVVTDDSAAAVNMNWGMCQKDLVASEPAGSQMNPDLSLVGSRVDPVYEYNQWASSFRNQDLQTVVHSAAKNMSQVMLVASVPGGSPQMNCGQPSLSPVNYSRQVNPKLTSSSTGTVHEYNRFASSFENQDLQTVVDSAALMNIYWGVSNGNLAASEPAGLGLAPSREGPGDGPFRYGHQVFRAVGRPSQLMDGPEQGREKNKSTFCISLALGYSSAMMDGLQCERPSRSFTRRSQPEPFHHLQLGPQMNQGQPSFSAVNYSPQVNPNSMISSTDPSYEYEKGATPIGDQDMQTLVNGNNSCTNMNWGSLTASTEASAAMNTAQQESAVTKPDLLSVTDMELSEFSEFEDYFTAYDTENLGKKQEKGQFQHPSSTQKNNHIDEFGA